MTIPKYRSHKVVSAFKIGALDVIRDGGSVYLVAVDGSRVMVNRAYMEKHNPQVGGYYVLYPDGYESWSPAEAFEQGYTLEVS